ASTLATLLGVAGPANGRGSPITELLDLSDADAAAIVCHEAARVSRFTPPASSTATPACEDDGATPIARIAAGRAVVRAAAEGDDAKAERLRREGVVALFASGLSALLLFAAIRSIEFRHRAGDGAPMGPLCRARGRSRRGAHVGRRTNRLALPQRDARG